jgi:PhnB protein
MTITPVMNFSGDCEDAIHLYEHAFDTKADVILHYADAKPEDWDTPLTEQQQHSVYHAEMHIGNQRVMLSDIIEFEIIQGTACFLAVAFETKEDVERAYAALSQDSTILTPMKRTSYSSCFVNFIDKYGIRWALMTEQTEY